MKKSLFLLSAFICLSTLHGFSQTYEEQVIELAEISCPIPLDEPGEDDRIDPSTPPATRFQATISGNVLHVVANTGMIARMQVENNETGEVVEDKSFTANTVASISAAGSYTLYIQSGNTMVAGDFEVE